MTSEETVRLGIQSPSWEKWASYQFTKGEVVRDEPGVLLPKPKIGVDGTPQPYDIITRDGQTHTEAVPRPNSLDSSVSAHDRDKWTIKVQGANGERYVDLSTLAVLAWKEH